MKSIMQVVALMSRYNMRKNEGPYTFGFTEGKYFFSYHDHSTGRDIRIFIVAPDGDKMLVYDKTEWYSSRYYFNGFGSGFVSGPWVKEIDTIIKRFKSELAVKLQSVRTQKKEYKKSKLESETKTINKFAALCAV